MKKTLAVVLMMVMMMSIEGSTVYAQGAYSKQVEADVLAKYSRNIVANDTFRIEISKKTVNQKLQNGMTVQIKNESPANLGMIVVIRIVNEEKPLDWVTSQMKNYGEVVQPLYVSFYRNGMKVQPEGNIFISLKLPKKYSANAAYFLSGAGEVEILEGNYKKGAVELYAKEGYVVLMRENTSRLLLNKYLIQICNSYNSFLSNSIYDLPQL